MESAWIKIFVLTLSECIAPPGKTVCQENTFDLEFLTRADCEAALVELISLKDASPAVIVDKRKSGCRASARQQVVYASPEDVGSTVEDAADWREPEVGGADESPFRTSYEERLKSLETCEESRGVAPCKVGEIIIEGATGEPVEVWRSVQ